MTPTPKAKSPSLLSRSSADSGTSPPQAPASPTAPTPATESSLPAPSAPASTPTPKAQAPVPLSPIPLSPSHKPLSLLPHQLAQVNNSFKTIATMMNPATRLTEIYTALHDALIRDVIDWAYSDPIALDNAVLNVLFVIPENPSGPLVVRHDAYSLACELITRSPFFENDALALPIVLLRLAASRVLWDTAVVRWPHTALTLNTHPQLVS